MLKAAIVAIVTRCTRHAWLVIVLSTLLGVASGVYAARHFAINTDINTLISTSIYPGGSGTWRSKRHFRSVCTPFWQWSMRRPRSWRARPRMLWSPG